MAVLEVQHITHTYAAGSPFEQHAIRDVSLTTVEGELLGIIGHTGSGKSTLIQHLNGLLRPSDGRILLDLDYHEDSRAEIDMNLVMNDKGEFIEIQGTGERATFDRGRLDQLLDVGQKGLYELLRIQRAAIGE